MTPQHRRLPDHLAATHARANGIHVHLSRDAQARVVVAVAGGQLMTDLEHVLEQLHPLVHRHVLGPATGIGGADDSGRYS